MKKKVLFISCAILFCATLVFNIQVGRSNSSEDIALQSLKIAQAAADETQDYSCCPPYKVKCGEGNGFVVWGTLTQGIGC